LRQDSGAGLNVVLNAMPLHPGRIVLLDPKTSPGKET
jgi:hypothetical protein